jgi:predicted nucleic acid-binding protein
MPTTRAFVDTNVLHYAVSTNPIEAEMRRVAREIIDAGQTGISVQVAQEFFVNATRKFDTASNWSGGVDISTDAGSFRSCGTGYDAVSGGGSFV